MRPGIHRSTRSDRRCPLGDHIHCSRDVCIAHAKRAGGIQLRRTGRSRIHRQITVHYGCDQLVASHDLAKTQVVAFAVKLDVPHGSTGIHRATRMQLQRRSICMLDVTATHQRDILSINRIALPRRQQVAIGLQADVTIGDGDAYIQITGHLPQVQITAGRSRSQMTDVDGQRTGHACAYRRIRGQHCLTRHVQHRLRAAATRQVAVDTQAQVAIHHKLAAAGITNLQIVGGLQESVPYRCPLQVASHLHEQR